MVEYEIEIKVKLLMDVLAVKLRTLTQILNITENQESLLLSDDTSGALSVFFDGMSREKQVLIDEVTKADNLFQSAFNEISEDFERFAQGNKELVVGLQEGIKRVMDVDIKIRVMEQRNRELVSKHKKGGKIAVPKASKGYLLEQYKKNGERIAEKK